MSTLTLLATLLGAALGMKFRVFILIPAIGFALVVILTYGIERGTSVSGILIAVLVASSCLQVGYIFSIVARYGIALARSGRKVSLRSVR
jgi:uncharacterized membrane protein